MTSLADELRAAKRAEAERRLAGHVEPAQRRPPVNPETILKRPELRRRARARRAVEAALRSGRLVRRPCEHAGCGDPRTEAHHTNYARPLDVRWLCRTHHSAADDTPPILV